MLNLKKCTKNNLNLNCSYMCAYHCVQLPYTTQHRGVLIIFPHVLQTIIIAQIMSTGGNGVWIITKNVRVVLLQNATGKQSDSC